MRFMQRYSYISNISFEKNPLKIPEVTEQLELACIAMSSPCILSVLSKYLHIEVRFSLLSPTFYTFQIYK